jgi:hypothetical protein
MELAKKVAMAALLLLIVEVLYVDIDPVSVGFPFRSVQLAYPTPGHTLTLVEESTAPGAVRMEPILLIIDVSVAIMLGLLIVGCVPAGVIVRFAGGSALGTIAGAAVAFLLEVLPESLALEIFALIIILVFVPLAIYTIALGHRWQKCLIVIVSGVTVLTFWRGLFLVEGFSDGLMDDGAGLNVPTALRLLALSAVPICECLVIGLLHKKCFPTSWRKNRPAGRAFSPEKQARPGFSLGSDKLSRGRTVRRAVLCTVGLAVAIYVGAHFSTLRKMREDPFFLSNAIFSEFERREMLVRNFSEESRSESPGAGWNTCFRIEMVVNGDNTHYAQVSKHILIPWVRVKIHEAKDSFQLDEAEDSDEYPLAPNLPGQLTLIASLCYRATC